MDGSSVTWSWGLKDGRTVESTQPYPGRNNREHNAASAWDHFARLSPSPAAETKAYRARPRSTQADAPRVHPYLGDQSKARRSRPASKATGSLPNYYALIGAPRDATQEQVERAYRRRVRLIHPDQFFLTDPARHAVAQEKLKAVIEAMRVLRNPIERARYDALLSGRPLGARIGSPSLEEKQGQTSPAVPDRGL